MSKRTAGTVARSWWPTPEKAVAPLLRCLAPRTIFVEPCAGDGALVRILEAAGHVCSYACDTDPRDDSVEWNDALYVTTEPHEMVITNPPFEQPLLVPLLSHWSKSKSAAWLLLPSDLLMNVWFGPFAAAVCTIAPIGRVSWLGNGQSGFENSAWVRFDFARGGTGLLLPR